MSTFPMPVRTTAGLGLVTTGEGGMVLTTARGWAGNDRPPPLIFAHGATGRVMDGTALSLGQYELVWELAKYFTVIVTDLGGDQWANDTHISRIAAAKTYAAGTWFSSGPITLVGSSMGAAGCWAYAKANPEQVRCIAGIIPVSDIEDMRANNRGGLAASINAAYGGAYSQATHGALHNPVTIAPTLTTDIPVKLWYSNADVTVVPSTVLAIGAARPSTTLVDVGAGGHGQASIVAATDDVVKFVRYLQ